MNTISKMVLQAMLCLLATPIVHAQSDNNTRTTERPVNQIEKKWFTMDNEDEANYKFTIELDKGESLTLKFKRLSDWISPNDFKNAFSAANKVIAVYKDSLKEEQNTQILDIHVPANQKNIISRFNQYNESGNLMTINGDGASALKLGMDTLRILQNKPGLVQLQYTFVLKKLSNYEGFARDEAWMNNTAEKIDSIVTEYRGKWKNPNSKRHSLYVSYRPLSNKSSLIIDSRSRKDVLMIEGGIGVSLVRNMLCPNVEYGVGVYLSRSREEYTFVRLSSNIFYRFVETTPSKYKGYGTGFVNLELGSESNHSNPKSLFYKTSLGFGYKLINKKEENRDPTMSKNMYRIFFNYSVNKFFVITPEFVSNFKKGDNKNSWFGLSLNLKIF